jgi:large subunit ribosomal protein L25
VDDQYGCAGAREEVHANNQQYELIHPDHPQSVSRESRSPLGNRHGAAGHGPLPSQAAPAAADRRRIDMPATQTTALAVAGREPSGSRSARRLRRSGLVPGIVYGGGQTPIPFEVDDRTLRHVLASAGAVVDLSVDGAPGTPVVLKELTRHAVDGHTIHVDLLRVRLDQAIQATVALLLTGEESSPGVKEGGVLEHVTRELTVEALPTDIPDSIEHDVSAMQIGDTLTLEGLRVTADVKFLDDPDLVIATLSPPRLQTEAEEGIEQETELVGDDGAKAAPEGEAGSDEE